jgi:ABC-2 type transport system permease protein
MRKAWEVFRREYLERVRKKSFVILTLIGPFLIAAMVVIPNLLIMATPDEAKPLAVVDLSGRVGERFAELVNREDSRLDDGSPRYPVRHVDPAGRDLAALQEELNQEIAARDIFGYLVIPDTLEAGAEVSYYAKNASNIGDQEAIQDALSDAVIPLRFREAGMEMELDGIRQLTRRVRVEPTQIGSEGEATATGRGAQFGKLIAAYGMVIVLYMTFLLWGMSIMRGVVEEKTSKVIEVLLSSVTPRQLMAGKVLGIGAVALTQYLVWAATSVVAYYVMTAQMSMEEWVSTLSIWTVVAFVGYFILGYLLYASYFAALGSCCSTDQEAQQLQQFGIIPIVVGFFLSFYVFMNPDSTVATVLSLIPPFTPFIMLVRIAVLTPPLWEIALSVLFIVGGIALLTTLAAKVFRVGILMTGKKPTLVEIWRWIRYA